MGKRVENTFRGTRSLGRFTAVPLFYKEERLCARGREWQVVSLIVFRRYQGYVMTAEYG
jgi:hypothetical protein